MNIPDSYLIECVDDGPLPLIVLGKVQRYQVEEGYGFTRYSETVAWDLEAARKLLTQLRAAIEKAEALEKVSKT